jgi:hypothetical protein
MNLTYQETIKRICKQLKATKEAITVIEFKLSQLESETQTPAAGASSSRGRDRLELRRDPRLS